MMQAVLQAVRTLKMAALSTPIRKGPNLTSRLKGKKQTRKLS